MQRCRLSGLWPTPVWPCPKKRQRRGEREERKEENEIEGRGRKKTDSGEKNEEREVGGKEGRKGNKGRKSKRLRRESKKTKRDVFETYNYAVITIKLENYLDSKGVFVKGMPTDYSDDEISVTRLIFKLICDYNLD
ncbi:hypothetical protein RCL_jg13872.t1 [Rhizophagus clarus]|uniref:Uncharacterized protein n=1 Tax=Rhizophagus clarus TaxID=94130 RepID=A0A8H3LMX4_9GLOM|nr:hypothetical protein RCL_jg13872.t1 [Rhizophagus clarus]